MKIAPSIRHPALLILALSLSQAAVCADAQEAGTGSTEFRLSLDPKGALTRCEITSSSGDAENDDRVCEFLRTRAHFQPRSEQGEPIAYVFTSRMRFERGNQAGIKFRMIDETPISDRQVDTIVGTTKLLAVDEVRFLKAHALIEPDGTVEKSTVIKTSGDDRIDNVACDALKNNLVGPAVDPQNNPVRSVWDMKIMVRGFAAKPK